MCHFVTAVLPSVAPITELDELVQRHGKQLKLLENDSVAGQIAPSEAYFLVTAGYCDCGTPLGALLRGVTSQNHDRLAEARRLRLKGWSETKIERSLTQRFDHLKAVKAQRIEDNAKSIQEWIDFLNAVLGSGKTKYIGLLLHMYDGALSARLTFQGREVVKQPAITAALLGRLKEDVLYEFRA